MKIKIKYNRKKILLSTDISSFIELVFSASSKLYDLPDNLSLSAPI